VGEIQAGLVFFFKSAVSYVRNSAESPYQQGSTCQLNEIFRKGFFLKWSISVFFNEIKNISTNYVTLFDGLLFIYSYYLLLKGSKNDAKTVR